MNCHMVPNFHNAMHLVEYILAYGPVYGWWVWAYEHAIGILSKVNNNGHGGGEVEGTYMRAWWKTIFAQELVRYYGLYILMVTNWNPRLVTCNRCLIAPLKITRQLQHF